MENLMIKNAVIYAQNKLKQHQERGVESKLTINEVARLMDVIKFGPTNHQITNDLIFFNYKLN